MCNVHRRMAILYGKGLVRRGIALDQNQDRIGHKRGCPMPDMWQFVRNQNIQALRAMHPTATLVDFYFLTSVIGPRTFSAVLKADSDREASLVWTCSCSQGIQSSERHK
jgi:hypothetical protein